MKVVALVLSGGIGVRFGGDIPKQYVEAGGKPVLVHTLHIIEKIEEISDIFVVCAPEWTETVERYKTSYGITKLRDIFPGGRDGWESISHGIDGLKPLLMPGDIVIIQDGNRCCTSPEIFLDGIRFCKESGMAIACVKQYNECFLEGTPQQMIDRNQSYVLHRPEFFEWEKLKRIQTLRDGAPGNFALSHHLRS